MRAHRIILVDLPQLLREIIEYNVGEQPDMEIVGELCSVAALSRSVRERGADFVIAGSDLDPDVASGLLHESPCLSVLTVVGDGRKACLYELRTHRTTLLDISPQAIVDVIRSDTHRAT